MSFSSLNLIEPLLKAVNELGYKEPSPIQAQAIPAILARKDILASSQTGTGKTASFTLPILQNIHDLPRARNNRTRVLIVTPTRELANQVHESIIKYGRYLSIRSAVVFGGVKINPQMMKLRPGVEILVATPGRLLDLQQQGAVKLNEVDTLVLDEADRMLDMGFIHDIKKIIKLLPAKRQNLMFSATFSDEIRALVKGILHQPVEINVARNETAHLVTQIVHLVDKEKKSSLLTNLIVANKWEQALVFSRTKHGANKLTKILMDNQIEATAIHGNKSQSQRTKALANFKAGKVRVLVATDIAARGIDIDQLPYVVNFDLPQVPEDYIHRIGRTGRAKAAGFAISLVSQDEIGQLNAIEKLIKYKIDRVEVDNFKPKQQRTQLDSISRKKPNRNERGFQKRGN